MRAGEDETPKKPVEKVNLEEMSIDALGAYLDTLHVEIERVRAAIVEKRRARVGADALFKS